METTDLRDFRLYLQNQLAERCQKNPRYSLRAFAKTLSINHATLSQILNGKRKLTKATMLKFSEALGLGPDVLGQFDKRDEAPINYQQVSIDTFIATSDWYYDAILELTRLSFFKPDHSWIAAALGISLNEVNIAVERLFRLELLKKTPKGKWFDASGDNTNNHVGDFTNTALKKYQKQILAKAIDAIDLVSRELRDNTGIMLTINKKDIPEAKQKIKKFRAEMGRFFTGSKKSPDEVYKLAVAFFPISKTDQKE